MKSSFGFFLALCFSALVTAFPCQILATTHVLPANVSGVIYPWSDCFADTVLPGDVIQLAAQTNYPYYRNWLSFNEFCGTSNDRITITKQYSPVQIMGSGTAALQLADCENIFLDGRNSFGGIGGIEIIGSLEHGIKILRSDSMEVRSLYVHDCNEDGAIGVSASGKIDSNSFEAIRDISIHDLIVSECGTGMYLGCCLNDVPLDTIIGLHVYNNLVSYCENRGVQVAGAQGDVRVHHNIIEYTGQVEANKQGLMINPGSSGLWYNNWIEHSDSGQGIYVQGVENSVFNNVIVGASSCGIFWRLGEGSCFENTIVNTSSYGFQAWVSLSDYVSVYDNIVSDYGSIVGICTEPAGYLDIYNNLEYEDSEDAGFKDAASNDFHLTASADALDAGSASGYADFDYDDVERPQGEFADIGAFEYVSRMQKQDRNESRLDLIAYPNPFNPSVCLEFSMKQEERGLVFIASVSGQMVRILASHTLSAGRNFVEWDGKDSNGMRVASGVYFAVVQTQSQSAQKKLIMLK